MKKTGLLAVVTIILLAVVFTATKERPIHIYMAGDSTMALKPLYKTVIDSISGDSIIEEFPERGWGQLLPEFFNQNVIVEDLAQNGRSSRTFIEQGWWDKIMEGIQKGDYVVIQFGHNDSAADRADRYTTPEEYLKNLSQFVDDVRMKEATPIICTSVVRRRFDKHGNFQDSHGEYVDLARQVVKEKEVIMIDMYEKSKNLLISMGKEESAKLFLHVPPGVNRIFPEGKTDNTHFKEEGARKMASFFIEGLKENHIKKLTTQLKN